MSTNSTFTNDKLPLDVLGGIFQDFAAMETAGDPLEKLLLICKNWNLAARSHRSIWKVITVEIQHERTFSSCISYATRRLALSGSSVPLDIIVDTSPFSTRHDPSSNEKLDPAHDLCCSRVAVSIAEKILDLLAGFNGQECRRWKHLMLSFYLSNRDTDMTSACDFNALKYPMPNLETLRLQRFSSNGEVFGHCPSLVDVYIEDAHIPSLSVFQNVQNMDIECWILNIADLSGLTGISRMEKLELRFLNPDVVFLPATLPLLSNLCIGGTEFPHSFDLQVPSLTDLTVDYDESLDIENLVDSSALPFSQIKRLEVRWDEPAILDILDLEIALWLLLSKCTSVREVTLSPIPFTALLKIMWIRCSRVEGESVKESISPWKDRAVKIRMRTLYADKGIEFSISGAEDKETLAQFAREAGTPDISGNWKDIWEFDI